MTNRLSAAVRQYTNDGIGLVRVLLSEPYKGGKPHSIPAFETKLDV